MLRAACILADRGNIKLLYINYPYCRPEAHGRSSHAGMCAQVNAIVGEVIPTRVQLTFSQLQNFIASIAIEREYDYYFWGHADVALMASNATATFSEEVFGCVACLQGIFPDACSGCTGYRQATA